MAVGRRSLARAGPTLLDSSINDLAIAIAQPAGFALNGVAGRDGEGLDVEKPAAGFGGRKVVAGAIGDGRAFGGAVDGTLAAGECDFGIGSNGPLAAGAALLVELRFGDEAEVIGVLAPFFVGGSQTF